MKKASTFYNERGLALLISIVILFLLSTAFLHMVKMYESEKRFIAIEKEWNTLDHMLVVSVDRVIQLLDAYEEEQLLGGSLDFLEGNVHYQIRMEEEKYNILLRATLNNGSERGARFTYDEEENKVGNWVEGVYVQ